MRFIVERTSVYGGRKPCGEAVPGMVQSWDARTFKSPDEYDEKFGGATGPMGGPWLSKGTDHEIIRGPRGGATGIRRRLADKAAWFVDIESLEELVAFVNRHGDVVIGEHWMGDPHLRIEIYDGYRE